MFYQLEESTAAVCILTAFDRSILSATGMSKNPVLAQGEIQQRGHLSHVLGSRLTRALASLALSFTDLFEPKSIRFRSEEGFHN